MKKTLLPLLTFLCIGITLSAQNTIKLNEPNKQRGVPVMQAFENKKPISTFESKTISIQDLSDLLWAANGINRTETSKITMPTVQNSHDIDIYVALEEAVYLYDAFSNSLSLITEGDHRDASGKKTDESLPPCTLYLVCDASKHRPGNDSSHASDMNKVNAGVVSQNISLFCAGTGLGTKPGMGMNKTKLRKVLKLTDSQDLVLNHRIGYPVQ